MVPRQRRTSYLTSGHGVGTRSQRMNSGTSLSPMDLHRYSTAQRVSGVAIIVVAVAAFLPWASILGITLSGIRGDGVITLVLALVGGAALAVRVGLLDQVKVPSRVGLFVSLACAALVALIGLVDMNGAAAIGLYLTLIGGIAWVVGAVWELRDARLAPDHHG
jgi:predicted membrane channel-forming protein YqfA (hemolysin III family)